MATETLVPNGIGDTDNWTLAAGSTKVAAVTPPDDDATSYINSGTTTATHQRFTLSDPVNIGAGDTINSVTLRYRHLRGGTPAGSIRGYLMLSTNVTTGTTISTGASWLDQSEALAKPGGGTWTLTDLNNLVVGVQNTQTRDVWVTSIEVTVEYTPLAGPAELELTVTLDDAGLAAEAETAVEATLSSQLDDAALVSTATVEDAPVEPAEASLDVLLADATLVATAEVTLDLVVLAASTNITASGENTTAQLTPPAGKTTDDFVAGRIQDDENPADNVDITVDDYTELEWSLKFTSSAVASDQYEFRTTVGGVPLDAYDVTPTLTVGTGELEATLSAQLEDAGLAAEAETAVEVTLTVQLADATLVAAAVGEVEGLEAVLDAVLADATLTTAAETQVEAALTSQLSDAALVAAVATEIEAALTSQLSDAVLAATASVDLGTEAVLDVTLADASLAATVETSVEAVLTAQLSDAQLVAAAETQLEAELTALLEDAQLVAAVTATSGIEAVLDVVLADATLTAAAETRVDAALTAQLADAVLTSTAVTTVDATVGVVLEDAGLVSEVVVGFVPVLAEVDVTLADATMTAAVETVVGAAVDYVLADASLAAEAETSVYAVVVVQLANAVLEAAVDVNPILLELDVILADATLVASAGRGLVAVVGRYGTIEGAAGVSVVVSGQRRNEVRS